MATLDNLTKSNITKLLLVGDSGTGKTGALASLVKAGYKLRVLDMDNGWESLASAVKRTCPELLSTVQIESIRDKYKGTAAGAIIDGAPTAFTTAMKLLDQWKTPDTDLGKPMDWGSDTILAIDSLTFLSDAAYNWADFMNPGVKDKRQVYYQAQQAVENFLALVTGESFKTNVIITAHIKFVDMPDGTKRGYPTSVGSALSPTIPRYFNSVACCQTQPGGKRSIQTSSTPMIDLKNPASFTMSPSLPIETGLADFFKTLRS